MLIGVYIYKMLQGQCRCRSFISIKSSNNRSFVTTECGRGSERERECEYEHEREHERPGIIAVLLATSTPYYLLQPNSDQYRFWRHVNAA